MVDRKTNPPFLNGVPELLMLRLLARRPMYGYELVQAIRASTHGELEFGEGCVYPILHRLESLGILRANREQVAGRARLVYRLLPKGQARLTQVESTWQRVVAAVNHALQGGERGRQALA
jgi:PadR family transcriptional regulator PadR